MKPTLFLIIMSIKGILKWGVIWFAPQKYKIRVKYFLFRAGSSLGSIQATHYLGVLHEEHWNILGHIHELDGIKKAAALYHIAAQNNYKVSILHLLHLLAKYDSIQDIIPPQTLLLHFTTIPTKTKSKFEKKFPQKYVAISEFIKKHSM